MTFSTSWSGLGRNFPGLAGVISPAVSTLSDEEAEHARHIGHIVSHWAAENEHCQLTISLAAGINPRYFNLQVTTVDPAVSESEEPDVDSSKSQDPFAPDKRGLQFSDGSEIEGHTDPLKPAEVDDGEQETAAGEGQSEAAPDSAPQAAQEPEQAAGEDQAASAEASDTEAHSEPATEQAPDVAQAQEQSAQELAPPNQTEGEDGPGDVNPEQFPAAAEPEAIEPQGAPAETATPDQEADDGLPAA